MAEIRLKSTGTIKLFENDNTSSVTIASPASLGADRTITLPDASVTLASGTMNDATNLSGTVPIANGGTASTSTTYCSLASNVTGNLPVANLNSGTSASSSTFWRGDGAWVAPAAGGITGYDKWRVNTSFSGDAQPVASNWERNDHANFAKIGTGMTESSGIFTFPETGLWKIIWHVQFYGGSANAYGRVQIDWSTNSGVSYVSNGWSDQSGWGTTNSGNNGQYVSETAMTINVTDASTFRCQFEAELSLNSQNIYGAAADATWAEFTRLADDQ